MNRNRKWKYVGKAVLSGVLVTSLLVGNIGYAEAKPISQEETIYVELAEDGSVKEVTVSDLLKQEGKENVTKEQKADKETKLPVDVTITYLLDGKEISYQQLKSLSPDDLLHDVWEILPESTNLESKFGSKAKKGIWVLASKKNPSYLEEFEKKLAEN